MKCPGSRLRTAARFQCSDTFELTQAASRAPRLDDVPSKASAPARERRRREAIVVIEEAQILGQHWSGMVNRLLVDDDVASDGVFREIVFGGEPLDLLFSLLFRWRVVLESDVELRSLRLGEH